MSKRKSSNELDRPLPMTLEDHVNCADRIYIVSQEHSLLVADFHKKKCEEGRFSTDLLVGITPKGIIYSI